MIVKWTQHAVGHGGFHTGLALADNLPFTWMFDCGARRHQKFKSYLLSWLKTYPFLIDWLFISHFDADHVSGLEVLMSRRRVQNVMIPYVNDHELAYLMLYELQRGRLNRSLIELIADPASFFLSRGASRVTFVGGPEGGEEPDLDGSPIDGPREPEGWQIKIRPNPARIKRRIWTGKSIVQNAPVQIVRGPTCEVYVSRGVAGLRLIPYRLPANPIDSVNIIRALTNLIRPGRLIMSRPGLGNLAYAIADHARTSPGRTQLKNVYKNHVGSSNRSSLSLLTIPQYPDLTVARWQVRSHFRRYSGRGAAAWLTTGDAELLDTNDLASWHNAYLAELADVRVLALPHHGSDRNSNHDLQNLCPAALLAAHVKSGSSKHPGQLASLTAGSRLVPVTEQPETELTMQFATDWHASMALF